MDMLYEVEKWVRRLEVFWGPRCVEAPNELNLVRDVWIRNRIAWYVTLPNGTEILKSTVEALEADLAEAVFKKKG